MARRLTRGNRNIAWIEAYCRAPEGKDVGKPIKLRPWQKRELRKIYDSPTRRAILSFGRKNGKCLAVDTPIPTPSGWTTMGEIQPGDQVFGADGRPTRVLFVSDVFDDKECYRVSFSDGSSVVATDDHLWRTRHSFRPWASARVNGSGNGGRWRTGVVTTAQIAGSVLRPRADGGKESNHKIDIAPALVVANAVDLPVDPYVMGAWLGDGTSTQGAFTCSEADLPNLQAAVADCYRTRVLRHGEKAPTLRAYGLSRDLRKAGVFADKHIPNVYFDASTEQRWRLLQGLMDTDGTVTLHAGKTTPRCAYSGTNARLVRDVWRLARSLGLKATIREYRATIDGRDCGPAWDASFPASIDAPVFSLDRKQELLPQRLAKRSSTLTVAACDRVTSVPTKCIMVEADDSLYLAGHGCVPTHNTSLSAMLLLLHLCGPEARPNSQLFSAAQSRDQAAILYSLAAKMVRMSPDLSAVVTPRETAKQLVCEELGTLYRALSAEASTSYGLSPAFLVHDELGQVKGPRSELYDALETAAGAQEDPLSIIISTQAPTDGDLLSILIDDALAGHDPRTKVSLYTAPLDVDPFSRKAQKAANPALGDFLNAREVSEQAHAAKRMPAREAAYRNLVLNQRVNQVSPFVAQSTWTACGGAVSHEAFSTGKVYVGLDLSARNDLTALVAVTQDADEVWHVRAEFFAPADGIHDRAMRDRVPYDVWRDQGYLLATPGASVDYAWVADRLMLLCDECDVARINFDRWRIDVLQAELSRQGVELPLEPHGQGFKDMAPALDTLEAELSQHRIRHGNNPVLTWCASNAIAVSDPAGNRKLDKSKSYGRIDGMVALAMAMSGAHAAAEAEPVSPWDDPEFSYLGA